MTNKDVNTMKALLYAASQAETAKGPNEWKLAFDHALDVYLSFNIGCPDQNESLHKANYID